MVSTVDGIIIKAISGFYYVETDNGIIECKARGKFRIDGVSPLVGDRVQVQLDGNKGSVTKVFQRKNQLDRPTVANIDKLFIISSLSIPTPNALIIDRLTALCEYKKITPIVVFNKSDLAPEDEWVSIYKSAGIKTILSSTVTKEGIDEIKKELSDSVSVFTGNSGVGKSSLINCLFPTLKLITADVSDKLGRGRHTTRHCELFKHEYGGYIADTPGFSSLDTDVNDIEFKNCLAECFIDFTDYTSNCRFTDCAHIGEKGCTVCQAVLDGKIQPSRYESYKQLFSEMKNIKEWNIKK